MVNPVVKLLPELLAKTLARHDNVILTYVTDPETGAKKIPILSGKFIISYVRKLMGQAES
jgi:hypothetical protein